MNQQVLINVLLGRNRPLCSLEKDTVPFALSGKYDREGAALNLRKCENLSQHSFAVIFRVALYDEEPDVKLACIETLLHHDEHLGEIVACATTFDDDPAVRDAALQVLVDIGSECSRTVAERLVKDEDPMVAATALAILKANDE